MDLINLVLLVTNLIILAMVAYLFFHLKSGVKKELQTVQSQSGQPGSSPQLQHLEEQFKRQLEDLISKNKLVIQNTSDNLVKYYQDTVMTMTLNYNQNTERLMQLLDSELKKRIENLDKASLDQIQIARSEVNNQIKQDLLALNQELDRYSKERFKQLDEKIYEIVAETAKNSVGKVINLVDHQELVMTALDQAKKDKFFS